MRVLSDEDIVGACLVLTVSRCAVPAGKQTVLSVTNAAICCASFASFSAPCISLSTYKQMSTRGYHHMLSDQEMDEGMRSD